MSSWVKIESNKTVASFVTFSLAVSSLLEVSTYSVPLVELLEWLGNREHAPKTTIDKVKTDSILSLLIFKIPNIKLFKSKDLVVNTVYQNLKDKATIFQ